MIQCCIELGILVSELGLYYASVNVWLCLVCAQPNIRQSGGVSGWLYSGRSCSFPLSCFYQLCQIYVSYDINLSFSRLLYLPSCTHLSEWTWIIAIQSLQASQDAIVQLQIFLNCAAEPYTVDRNMCFTGFLLLSGFLLRSILLACASIAGSVPAYIRELCVPVSSQWLLCSARCEDMQVPHFCTWTRSHRAFFCIGLTSWNSLPLHLHAVAFDPVHQTFSNYLRRICLDNTDSHVCRTFFVSFISFVRYISLSSVGIISGREYGHAWGGFSDVMHGRWFILYCQEVCPVNNFFIFSLHLVFSVMFWCNITCKQTA